MNDEPQNEAPRFIQLGRSIDSDLTVGEELLIEWLSTLEPPRIRRVVDEALGRAEIALEVLMIQLDPGGES